jgi:hypothetical protein
MSGDTSRTYRPGGLEVDDELILGRKLDRQVARLGAAQDDASALALYFVWYNFVKLHKAHKLTPALAAGITDKLWSVEDIVALVEASEPKPGKRGPYKKRAAA